MFEMQTIGRLPQQYLPAWYIARLRRIISAICSGIRRQRHRRRRWVRTAAEAASDGFSHGTDPLLAHSGNTSQSTVPSGGFELRERSDAELFVDARGEFGADVGDCAEESFGRPAATEAIQ